MRILALGCTLPNPQVDNYNWASAPSFFDYDALVIDPADGVSSFVEAVVKGSDDYLTYDQAPVTDGPSTPTSTGLADILRRRADEVERLLARGGLIVCFAQPDVLHSRVAGFNGCHRFYWLPAPAGLDYGSSNLHAADGFSLTGEDDSHPFAVFFQQYRNKISYRAIFQEGPGTLCEQGLVLARSPGGAALALDIKLGGGRVIFLPALPDNQTSSEKVVLGNTLVNAIRNTILVDAEGVAPAWLARYSLPGIAGSQREIDEADEKIQAAEAEFDEARGKFLAVDLYRRLLWQEGKYGYDLPVRDALALLGMTNMRDADQPASFFYEGETVMVETESSPDVIGLNPHYRLRQRIEERLAQEQTLAHGIIVINGLREQDPATRPAQFSESLRLAAETLGYCVLESRYLFEAVRAKLEEQDDGKAFCQALLQTRGIFVPEAATTASKTATPAQNGDQ